MDFDDLELESFDDDQGDAEEGVEIDDPDDTNTSNGAPATAPSATDNPRPGSGQSPPVTGPTTVPMTPVQPPRGSFLRAVAWSGFLILAGLGLGWDLETRYEYEDDTGPGTG